MASGKPLTEEDRARITRLARQNYSVNEIHDLTGFARSTIQRVLKQADTFPKGYVKRPRKEPLTKSLVQRFLDLFGFGKDKPKKKRRHRKSRNHRKPMKEMEL